MKQQISYALFSLFETLLRVLPIPCRTGLRRIGHPQRDAPVILTGNYHLTVLRLLRALRGIDAHLLVANSRGINVWCASAGGHLTVHDIVSAVKLSGVDRLVDHRRIILPQLAACGIEAREVFLRTGWRVLWGPVRARDLPAYLEAGCRKTPEMRTATFPWADRVEMAVAWAFPLSFLFSLLLFLAWRRALLPVAALTWGLSLLLFLAFPLFRAKLSPGGRRVGLVFFDFGRGGLQLIVWSLFLVGLVFVLLALGNFSWGAFLRWGFVSLVVILILSIDLAGSTPVLKSGLHRDPLWHVVLDRERCRNTGVCQEVCPRNCFTPSPEKRTVMTSFRGCIRCGACILQCPHEALRFEDKDGNRAGPALLKGSRLDLFGRRKTIRLEKS